MKIATIYVIGDIHKNQPTGVVILKYNNRIMDIKKVINGIVIFEIDDNINILELTAYYSGDKNHAPSRSLKINF